MVDLHSGASGIVLPVEPEATAEHSYYQMDAARLRTDGSAVLVSYLSERPRVGDAAVDSPLRLVSISTESILAGQSEPRVVVEDVGSLTGIPLPQIRKNAPVLRLMVLPGSDASVWLPLNRRTFDGPVPDGVEQILEVVFERPF